MPNDNLILQSAALRGEYKFDEAIALIESNIDSVDSDLKVNAWLEAFYAAREKGDIDQSKKFALQVAKEDPNIPSIQEYLK